MIELIAEDNCAIMIADQLMNFLENGNIYNSVNFPNIKLARKGHARLAISNANRPAMVGQISLILGEAGVNIQHMVNESKNDLAFTLIDIDVPINEDELNKIRAVDGVLNARQL